MLMLFELLLYTAAFLLGVAVSVMISAPQEKPPHFRRGILLISCILLAAQLVSFLLLGLSATKKLYPLIVHLPLWALLVGLLKTDPLQTAVSVLMAYMCCQVPRWIASLGLLLPEEHWLYYILYIPVAGIFLVCLRRYLAVSLHQFIGRSRKACLLMGLIPALYYLFDYITIIYTGLLRSGNMAAVQFMPSVVSIAYLIFIALYNSELEKQLQLSRERDFLALQLHQSGTAFAAMQQLQEKTLAYRHDMRHHFNLLQVYAADNNLDGIRQYLSAAQQDMEDLTPVRYCGNEIVNLLLSYYAAAADRQQVAFSVTAVLPAQLPYSETELCSLLSNGLENAIFAAAQVETPNTRSVSVHLGIHGNSFLIQIENTYSGKLSWQDGLPHTDRESHGLGTQSIRAIVRSHGGEAIFRGQNGLFQLRILLPCQIPDSKNPI